MSDVMEAPVTQEEPVDPWAEPRTTAGGSAETGWIVDVHDGNRHEVYRVDGADEAAAIAAAMDLFKKSEPTPDDPLAKVLAEFKANAAQALSTFDGYGQEAVTSFQTKGDKAIDDFKKAADAALEACKPPKADPKADAKHDTKHDDKKK